MGREYAHKGGAGTRVAKRQEGGAHRQEHGVNETASFWAKGCEKGEKNRGEQTAYKNQRRRTSKQKKSRREGPRILVQTSTDTSAGAKRKSRRQEGKERSTPNAARK